jgi:diguanylate cyclase (GGDEF)-like protein
LTLLVGHDVTERERLFREVERLSLTDPLTKLSNRRHFESEARRLIALALRHSHPLSVVMLDVDHFKKVNDTWGHGTGDIVLRGVANTCIGATRTTDVRGRLGGEEFCLLLPETDASGAAVMAERLRLAIASSVYEAEGTSFHVTVSFGVAELGAAVALEQLLAAADRALYRAKTTGRNRIVIASAEDYSDVAT